VRLLLPLSGSGRSPSPVPEAASEGSALRILLVDDEPHLLGLMAQILEQHGHTVCCANDGTEALALLARGEVEPDLLITDVSMPQLGGYALCARVREKRPGLPAIVISGFGDTLDAPDDRRTLQLAKPFDMDELTGMIQRLVRA
jgi:CheY-like chemotaxis protein